MGHTITRAQWRGSHIVYWLSFQFEDYTQYLEKPYQTNHMHRIEIKHNLRKTFPNKLKQHLLNRNYY